LDTKHVITSTTLTGVQMHQAAATATFDEDALALSPVKTAIDGTFSISGGNQITRTDVSSNWFTNFGTGFTTGSFISLRGTTDDDGTYQVSSISNGTITLCTAGCDASVTAAGSLVAESATTVAKITTGHDPGADTHSFINVLDLP